MMPGASFADSMELRPLTLADRCFYERTYTEPEMWTERGGVLEQDMAAKLERDVASVEAALLGPIDYTYFDRTLHVNHWVRDRLPRENARCLEGVSRRSPRRASCLCAGSGLLAQRRLARKAHQLAIASPVPCLGARGHGLESVAGSWKQAFWRSRREIAGGLRHFDGAALRFPWVFGGAAVLDAGVGSGASVGGR
jgi:hypothetical protein